MNTKKKVLLGLGVGAVVSSYLSTMQALDQRNRKRLVEESKQRDQHRMIQEAKRKTWEEMVDFYPPDHRMHIYARNQLARKGE